MSSTLGHDKVRPLYISRIHLFMLKISKLINTSYKVDPNYLFIIHLNYSTFFNITCKIYI